MCTSLHAGRRRNNPNILHNQQKGPKKTLTDRPGMTRPQKRRDPSQAERPTGPPTTGDTSLPAWLSRDPAGGWLIRVKAVPGASRDGIAGTLGDRLKIRITAPPEAGKANDSVCKLLARRLGVPRRAVTIEQGHAAAEKLIRVDGAPPLSDVVSLNTI